MGFLLLISVQRESLAQTVKIAAWGANGYGETWIPVDLPSVKAVAIAGKSGLALLQNGHLAAWGDNSYGQTNLPASATDIAAIATSQSHSLALRTNGTAIGWGASFNGSSVTNFTGFFGGITGIAAGYGFTLILQGGQVTQRPPFVLALFAVTPPSNLYDIKQISAGDNIAVALRSNGTVVVWGNPACTNPPAGLSDIKMISAGNDHVTALRSNGTVVAWGQNIWGQTNVPVDLSNVVSVAAGAFHNLAQKSDGSLVVWGEGWSGETTLPTGLTNIVGIAASGTFSMALVGDGAPCISKQPQGQTVLPGNSVKLGCTATGTSPLLFQWQHNGTNLFDATNSTLLLTNISTSEAGDYLVVVENALASSTSHVAQITLGNIISWGANSTDQTSPSSGLTNLSAISGGNGFSLALSSDGTVTKWGARSFDFPEVNSNITAIAAGCGLTSALLQSNGQVLAYGKNLYGETNVPAGLTNAVGVAAGYYFCLALKSDKTVVGWGNNSFGQTNVPVGLSNVTAIACGFYHALALKSDGRLAAWGSNDTGQTNVPSSLSNVVAIAAASRSSFALKTDGTIVAWGSGATIPPGLSNVVAISEGGFWSGLALRSDGTLVALGPDNYSGVNNIPAGLSNVVQISSGFRHHLAITGSGAPSFPTPLSERSVHVGDTLQLPTLAVGNQPMSYQWQFNGTNLENQTNALLSITNVPLSVAGEYRVIVSNALEVVTNISTVVTAIRDPLRFSTNTGQQYTNGTMSFRLTGLAGSGSVVIFASPDLESWSPILTNPPVVGTLDLTDFYATNSTRYYRAVEGP